MAVHPVVARFVPGVLLKFSERLRYPHVFLATMVLFPAALIAARWLPYPEEILIALGATMFITSKLAGDPPKAPKP